MENDGGVLAWTPNAIYSIAANWVSTVSTALADIPIDGKATLAGGPRSVYPLWAWLAWRCGARFFLARNERDATARRHPI